MKLPIGKQRYYDYAGVTHQTSNRYPFFTHGKTSRRTHIERNHTHNKESYSYCYLSVFCGKSTDFITSENAIAQSFFLLPLIPLRISAKSAGAFFFEGLNSLMVMDEYTGKSLYGAYIGLSY